MDFNNFIPHGQCLRWNSTLIFLQVIGDLLVALSYYVIPLFLLDVSHRINRVFNSRIVTFFRLFAVFIFFCGTGHLLNILTIWQPAFWLETLWNIGTASVSALTVAVLAWHRVYLLKIVASIQD